MEFDFVVVTKGGSDSALGVFGRRLAQTVFGDNEDAAGASEFDGGAETCHASADHNEIGVNALDGGGYRQMVQRV